jgi:hypothetical protein
MIKENCKDLVTCAFSISACKDLMFGILLEDMLDGPPIVIAIDIVSSSHRLSALGAPTPRERATASLCQRRQKTLSKGW